MTKPKDQGTTKYRRASDPSVNPLDDDSLSILLGGREADELVNGPRGERLARVLAAENPKEGRRGKCRQK